MNRKIRRALQNVGSAQNIRLCLLCVFLACGCGRTTSQHTRMQPRDYLETGLALQKVGNHLHAGYWFEAALLEHPEQEQRILRLLVVSQIRAGRLLAAQSGLERLRQISSGDSDVETLSKLINQTRNPTHNPTRGPEHRSANNNSMEVTP